MGSKHQSTNKLTNFIAFGTFRHSIRKQTECTDMLQPYRYTVPLKLSTQIDRYTGETGQLLESPEIAIEDCMERISGGKVPLFLFASGKTRYT